MKYRDIPLDVRMSLDASLCLLKSVIGGVALGFWMHRFSAGVFGVFLLGALGSIGWSVEYGTRMGEFREKQQKAEVKAQ